MNCMRYDMTGEGKKWGKLMASAAGVGWLGIQEGGLECLNRVVVQQSGLSGCQSHC